MAKASLRASAMYLAGLIARGMGYPKLASQAIASAIALRPEDPTFHYELGVASRKSHLLEEADASFRRALELKPDMAAAYSGLADTSRIRGNIADAVMHYERALSLDPDLSQAHLGMGIICRDQYRLEKAAHHFRRAVELDPGLLQAGEGLDEIIRLQKKLKDDIDRALAAISGGSATSRDLRGLSSNLNWAAAAGMSKWAVSRAAEWVKKMPQDRLAAYTLTALEGKTSPSGPPEGYVEDLFDNMAATFNKALRNISYQGPDLVARMIAEYLPARNLDILDAGCGTGLSASALKPYARSLTGVDLSAKMLEIAQDRGSYDNLHKSEIVSFLKDRPGAYDLIAASDMFCYFGDISDAVCAMAGSLRPNGRVVFTVEYDKEDADSRWRLLPNGRFSHTDLYVRDKVKEAGLTLVAVESGLLRQELGQNVEALVVLAHKEP
ncbi:MAG TPA: methyltransferase domain-containing protein [Patescibacteria group bacterium]|nr:methyltransferase domain-containing protein [Patescibacteria group bacterium]